jgi:hypothetical protein
MIFFHFILQIKVRNDQDLIDWLLNFVEFDPSFRIKQFIIQNLCKTPPFKFNSDDTPLNNENLVNRLWNLMKFLIILFLFYYKSYNILVP